MSVTVKLVGLKGIEKALGEIEKHTTRKATGRRVLKKAGEPLAKKMRDLAPRDSGDLADSYAVSTKLNKRQRKFAKKYKSDVEVYVGTNDPAGIQNEFGNVNQAPRPHVRPAWDSGKHKALKDIENGLRTEIKKTVDRQRKKAAR